MTVEVLSFGCRLNLAEGEAIRRAAEGAGDLTVINSCAVTNEAERQARQAIRRARRARPGARLLVTGCASELTPARFAAMPEVDGIVANAAKAAPAAYGLPLAPQPTRAPVLSGRDHARAFLEIQTGCDHRCTFCVIWQARGPSQSLPLPALIAAGRQALDRGQRELVLTGVDVTSYEGGLAPVVRTLLDALPELPRLRLSSLDPAEVDDPLLDLLAHEPRVMPHLHLSLQAGDDLILKRMRRRHSRAQAIALVARLKALRPEIAVGADLIAGFPTETEGMFAQTLDLLDACDVVHPHIFPFSPRDGTPAARMPPVPPTLVRERAARLRAHAASRRAAWLHGLAGGTGILLVERDGVTGHLENFGPVRLAAPHPPHTLLPVRLIAFDGERLQAVPQ